MTSKLNSNQVGTKTQRLDSSKPNSANNSVFKPIIRTITVEWLRKNNACEEGIALFQYIAGGDRVTMRFTAEDIRWMKDNFYLCINTNWMLPNTSYETFRIPGYYAPIPRYRAYLHVRWLYSKIAGKLPEFRKECLEKGIYL